MKEMVIDPSKLGYERIRAIKEGFAASINSSVDDIKLVGLSLYFLDEKKNISIQSRVLVEGYDPREYDL